MQKGAAMAEVVILLPVMILMWAGIDYFRRGYLRRMEAQHRSQTAAWALAFSNTGACFADHNTFQGFTDFFNDPASTNGNSDAQTAVTKFSGSNTSSMFLYGHANVEKQLTTDRVSWLDGSGGTVKGSTFIACNEVVPAAFYSAAKSRANPSATYDQYADQNVLSPLIDFVKSFF
jgi:hypothetical protein